MDASLNGYIKQPHPIVAWVRYSGTDALLQGEAVCYSIGHGAAADAEGRRHNQVERPSATNNLAFAGVARRFYSAKSGGQMVEICVPGSKGVDVALGADTVRNQGRLTFQAGGGSAAGRFVKAGFPGRGSIVPRQTVTARLSASEVGGWTLATDGVTLTATGHGAKAGDTVVILGGANDGTGAVVPGKYSVASVTDDDTVVLAGEAVTDTPAGTLAVTGYAYHGNPRCQADLDTGEESGGVEFVTPPNTGASDSMSYMDGGITYVCGNITVGSEDANGELADGDYSLKKGFHCLHTISTNDVKVTLETNGLQAVGNADPTSALANITLDAADEKVILRWDGIWVVLGIAGGATLG